MIIEDIFQKVKAYPNGEQVAKRMAQIWDFALDPDGEPASATRVLQVIEAWEEKLLQRDRLEITQQKPVLPQFEQAMRDSTDEEWAQFKQVHEIKPLEKTDKDRLFVDASGLVRDTGFEKWVLGLPSEPIDSEGIIKLHQIIHESRK